MNLRAALRIARLLVALVWRWIAYTLDRRTPSPHVRGFLVEAGRALGGEVRVEGRPLAANVLFVANHLSWFDILAMGGATGTRFISKAEVGDWPIVGRLAQMADTILIRREARGATRDQADMLHAALAEGRPVTLFAEGTTAGGRNVLPFRASLFAAVSPPPPGIRVQPVAIDYGADTEAVLWARDEPGRANALRLMGRKGRLHVTLRFLEPIDLSEAGDRKRLAERTRTAILAALPGASPAA